MTNGNGGELPVPASVTAPDDPTARKLAEVRAKRAALDEARARAETERETRDALEREERALADAEALAAAEREYGPEGRKIRAVETPLGLIIVKRSGNAAYRRFMDASKATTDEAERLVKPCVVYPSRAEFERITDEYPALWVRLAGALTLLAGHRNTELQEK